MDETNTQRAGNPTMDVFETQQIAIEGMTCDKCVETIEKALRGRDGVKDVQIDRQNALATVTFDTRKTNIPELHDILLRSGYRPKFRANES